MGQTTFCSQVLKCPNQQYRKGFPIGNSEFNGHHHYRHFHRLRMRHHPASVAALDFFRFLKNMSQNSSLLKAGVSAPALIVQVEDTGVTMNQSPQARLTLQVTPAGQPPFQAAATTFVGRFQVGLLVPGATVQVRYNPNDTSKVAIELLGVPAVGGMSAGVAQAQAALLADEQYYAQLRRTGQEAEAHVLTADDFEHPRRG